jgi:uncharacterized protein YndB with AHSA1/START domain
MAGQSVKHATLVFERICSAPVERVFAAFANPAERATWGTPSETAVCSGRAGPRQVGSGGRVSETRVPLPYRARASF